MINSLFESHKYFFILRYITKGLKIEYNRLCISVYISKIISIVIQYLLMILYKICSIAGSEREREREKDKSFVYKRMIKFTGTNVNKPCSTKE